MNEREWSRRKITNKQESGDNKAHAFKRLLAMRNYKFGKGKCSEDCAGKTKASNYCKAQKRKEVNIMGIETCSGDYSPHSEWENVSQNVPPEKFENEVFDREQLSGAVIKRNDMENLLNKSIFSETVTGSFVRLCVGKIYCIYEIIDLNQDRKDYQVGSKHTNLLLTLRCGSEKRFSRIDVVSNQPITQKEFLLWLATNLRDRHILPKLSDIAKKQMQIKEACKYNFPEADVEKHIQTKRKAGLKQNAVYRKICLILEREMAAGKDDVGKVQALEKEIQEIDKEHRAHIDNSGQHRYPVLSFSRVVQKHTIYRDELGVVPRGKSSFGRGTANPDQLNLEQYMRRKYKKSVVVSRSRLNEKLDDQEKGFSTTILEIPIEKEKKEGEAETERTREKDLHLQKFNAFKIELDTTGLIPFNEIFTNVKFDSPWDEIMKGY
ncbi:uncharacterized protein LOC6529186 [Drosophila yakuba]|uniref:Plus3 domain-containing protein n=1 Tax=Drosophila yakuba TaxID=7245 RepID=B4P6E8_DROYA|nr:uncharacterized protein LOC6529186 [Drosophila yakuba]EDW89905.1 uncharacterized protein Dyak_GE12937 [Drosophila yakuba]